MGVPTYLWRQYKFHFVLSNGFGRWYPARNSYPDSPRGKEEQRDATHIQAALSNEMHRLEAQGAIVDVNKERAISKHQV
eukprot:3155113-Rhodomonas_salina.1